MRKTPGQPVKQRIAFFPSSLREWITAGLLFLLALGLAVHNGWSKMELFWSVWIASLAVAAMLMFTAFVAIGLAAVHQGVTNRSRLSDWVIGIVLYLMLVIVPALLLGGVYLAAAGFVSGIVLREPSAGISFAMIGDLLATYWPLVLAGLLSRLMDGAAMLRGTDQHREDWSAALLQMILVSWLSASGLYLAAFVFAIAVLLADAMGLAAGGWLYVLVFAAFYILPAKLARALPATTVTAATGSSGLKGLESWLGEETLAELSAMFSEPVLSVNGRTHHYPDYRTLFASQEFSRFAETLRFAGEERRLKSIEMYLTHKVMEERRTSKSS